MKIIFMFFFEKIESKMWLLKQDKFSENLQIEIL